MQKTCFQAKLLPRIFQVSQESVTKKTRVGWKENKQVNILGKKIGGPKPENGQVIPGSWMDGKESKLGLWDCLTQFNYVPK